MYLYTFPKNNNNINSNDHGSSQDIETNSNAPPVITLGSSSTNAGSILGPVEETDVMNMKINDRFLRIH